MQQKIIIRDYKFLRKSIKKIKFRLCNWKTYRRSL